ncbi:MAG: 50S ribosomal protein L10 [Planctomycetes bacterium]|nr:50S ribosomal protein L10 [Planctomycetota bacterium]
MVNVLNKKIREEYTELFGQTDDCVFVNFQGLTVEEVNSFRASLIQNNIRMQVVRSSLASLVLKEMDRTGVDTLVDGPTAVVWGGDSIVHVSKSVHDFAKKSKKLKIKGGFLNAEPIESADVEKLTKVPDKPVLLGSLVYAFMSPLQGIASGISSLLSSLVNLVDALEKKRAEEG